MDKFIEEFEKLWKKYPDLRFGQFIINYLTCTEHISYVKKYGNPYYMEDEKFIAELKRFYEEK